MVPPQVPTRTGPPMHVRSGTLSLVSPSSVVEARDITLRTGQLGVRPECDRGYTGVPTGRGGHCDWGLGWTGGRRRGSGGLVLTLNVVEQPVVRVGPNPGLGRASS